MKRVIIETPYAGDVETNLKYLRGCLRDSLLRGEAPFASHGLYTQLGVLDDLVSSGREHGIQAGFAWRESAELTVFYVDRGWSHGMYKAREHCKLLGLPHEIRRLPYESRLAFRSHEDLCEFEITVLKGIAGLGPSQPWGAAVGACLETLLSRGLVTDRGLVCVTPEGLQVLKELEAK